MGAIKRILLGLALAILTALPASALIYGPDRSGVYGGAQGIGGLDNEIDSSGGFFNVPANDYFGNAVGETYIYSNGIAPISYGLTLGGYGPMPGTPASYGIPGGSLPPQWRGKYVDWGTGFIYMGARYYDYQSGRFLSADPAGHDGSMSLYSYCDGDPVNGIDPDGRLGVGANVENDGQESLTDQLNDFYAQRQIVATTGRHDANQKQNEGRLSFFTECVPS